MNRSIQNFSVTQKKFRYNSEIVRYDPEIVRYDPEIVRYNPENTVSSLWAASLAEAAQKRIKVKSEEATESSG
jgi:hypothetical protein